MPTRAKYWFLCWDFLYSLYQNYIWPTSFDQEGPGEAAYYIVKYSGTAKIHFLENILKYL
jgi:hypothetical protein